MLLDQMGSVCQPIILSAVLQVDFKGAVVTNKGWQSTRSPLQTNQYMSAILLLIERTHRRISSALWWPHVD